MADCWTIADKFVSGWNIGQPEQVVWQQPDAPNSNWNFSQCESIVWPSSDSLNSCVAGVAIAGYAIAGMFYEAAQEWITQTMVDNFPVCNPDSGVP